MLHLTEHERSKPVTLTALQRHVLAEEFRARFEPAGDGRVIVTPRDRVGFATVDDLQVIVRPKFPIRNLLTLLSEAADPYRWLDLDVASLPDTSLHDAVAALFARSCQQTFQQGILRSYHGEHQKLPFVRGRIRIDDYLRTPAPIPIPLAADVFDDDILENQILKATLAYLRSLPDLSGSTRSAILRALRAVNHVQDLHDPLRAFASISWTRQNLHYQSIIALAELILNGGSLDSARAGVSHSGFVIDMPQMVEQWARSALRTVWGLSTRSMPDHWGGHLWLDESRRLSLIPDLGVRIGDEWRFVGDVKYKALKGDAAPRDDLYQMHAYLTATGLSEGTLIYVGVAGTNRSVRISKLDRTIHIVSVDLNGAHPRHSLTGVMGRFVVPMLGAR